ncbi:hypothetical protein H5410_051197 [Solanum commersonii]|uniref:Uncharacterized protein n=1 Tax=Solanum commersonii TaxID=4109 RepID=A0A9J5WXR8_SOLCO|nr:hypothetical protein H5410_051197 [Solanum commersonii]
MEEEKQEGKNIRFFDEVGLYEGYGDIERGEKKFKHKITEDEPYYDNSDCDSFQSDEEEHCGLVFESVKEFGEAVTKYAIKKELRQNGCFQKEICKGQLLVAVAKDASIQMYQIAWLRSCIVEHLIKYNKEKWCKAFFHTFSKCDSIDSDMAESFNAWILGPRNKTIVTTLAEIRIKVMSRMSKLKAFADT